MLLQSYIASDRWHYFVRDPALPPGSHKSSSINRRVLESAIVKLAPHVCRLPQTPNRNEYLPWFCLSNIPIFCKGVTLATDVYLSCQSGCWLQPDCTPVDTMWLEQPNRPTASSPETCNQQLPWQFVCRSVANIKPLAANFKPLQTTHRSFI